MRTTAAWLCLYALVGMLAAVSSLIGSAVTSSWSQPLADFVAAGQSASTRPDAWAVLWLDQLPATLVGCAALMILTAVLFWACRTAVGADVFVGTGGVVFAAAVFALFNVPPPGPLLAIYSFVFNISGQGALTVLQLVSTGIAAIAFSVFAPVWPLVVVSLLTAAGSAFGALAGTVLKRLVLQRASMLDNDALRLTTPG